MSERTAQQAAAIGELDRDVFLRAGAGTGKTTVLVDRFCAAALDPELGVERILAFTFTERAADQLRRKVRSELRRRAEAAVGEERELVRAAERGADRAWISTIHGFCRRLLSSHPAAAGIDPRFRVLDEPEADRLASRAFDAALDALVEGGDAAALELAAANRRPQLLAMTRGAFDELRSHGHGSPLLPAPPEVDTPAAIAALVAIAAEAYEECEGASRERELVSRERIAVAARLDPAASPEPELLDALAGMRLVSKAQPFQGEACTRYTRALADARAAVAARVLGPQYERLRALVTEFGERYELVKAERSALDFEDLQLRAVGLLRGSEALRDSYRERFRHLMVDEFQDTNELQLALIEALRGPDTRLFMVGDEFQSIYGFRHADVDVYRRQHERFRSGEEENGVALPLTGNFRAAPELIAATNAIGSGLLEGFEPLDAASPRKAREDDPPVELLLTVDSAKGWEDPDTQLHPPPDDPSPAASVAEARLLAGRLRELVDSGEDPAEIVVLLRAFTHVNTVERVLTEAGLDPYVVGGRGFWSQQQIEDTRCLLQAIANPLEDEALLGALASPACGILPDTLWLLRRAATIAGESGGRERLLHLWPLIRDLAERGDPVEGDAEAAGLIPGEEVARLREFAQTLESLRARGTEGGLEALVERAATVHGYDLATLMRDDGPRRWSNVRKLMRLAREFEAREGPDLVAFVEYLDSSAARRDREAEAATRAEGHAGVRVMTVHNAKGLEFGVVAVADLGRRPKLGWTPLRVTAGGGEADGGEAARVGVQLGRLGRPGERLHDYDELAELAAGREAEEEGRLAYVAATRAKRRLLLSGTFNPRNLGSEPIRRKSIALQLIRALLDGDVTERELDLSPAAEGLPAGRLRLRVSAPGPGAGAALLRPRRPEVAPSEQPAGDPPLRRPSPPPALARGLSYSALSEFGRCGYRFYVERVLGICSPEDLEAGAGGRADGEAAAPEARRRYGPGVAVHSLLEWSARSGWRSPPPDRVESALREQGLDADPQTAERTRAAVEAWLGSALLEELRGGSARPEVPFVIAVDGTLIRGSIDLLASPPDGSSLVVDYKTDRLEGRDPEAAAAGYEIQRDLYSLAAASSGLPVRSAYVFLERPDSPVTASYGEVEVEAARERVRALLERLREARFEVTDRPHHALCHDCPARERLCSHPVGVRMRRDPEPPIVSGAESPPGGAEGRAPAEDRSGALETQLTLLDP